LARWETEKVATGERAETLRCSKTRGVASREAPGVVTRGHEGNHITRAKTFLSISTAAAVGPYGFQSRIFKKFAATGEGGRTFYKYLHIRGPNRDFTR
jgi:hypothetical protein